MIHPWPRPGKAALTGPNLRPASMPHCCPIHPLPPCPHHPPPFHPFTQGPIFSEWFKGGKTNIAYNCLDRHVKEGHGKQVRYPVCFDRGGEGGPRHVVVVKEGHSRLAWLRFEARAAGLSVFQAPPCPHLTHLSTCPPAHPMQVCFYFEGNDIGRDAKMTYEEVLKEVCRVSNWLRSMGVKKGDSVAIYMPMVCELPIAMLACARIGAVHSVVFGGFSSDALASRIEDCKARVLITCNGACVRGLWSGRAGEADR